MRAFVGLGITSAIMPSNLTEIGAYAFSQNNLTDVTLPSMLVSILDGAFESNKLVSVELPNSVTSIGMSTFDCNNLTTITIGSGVISVGSQAFSGNTHQGSTGKSYGPNSITSVTINQVKSDIFNGIFGWVDGYTDSNIVFNG